MKDQYVGDVSDYLKYATLRAWSREALSVGLAWMRTEADRRSDGRLTRYLERPELYRNLDPELFDGLAQLVVAGRRSVRSVVEMELVGEGFSDESIVSDGREPRDVWFGGLAERAKEPDILFFDPDNGLEVRSVARGRPGSRRYLYVEELRALWRSEQAAVVYQHFPRVPRDAYLDRQLSRLAAVWPGALTFAVCSPRIALLASVPSIYSDTMLNAVRALVDRDPGGVGGWIYLPASMVAG